MATFLLRIVLNRRAFWQGVEMRVQPVFGNALLFRYNWTHFIIKAIPLSRVLTDLSGYIIRCPAIGGGSVSSGLAWCYESV